MSKWIARLILPLIIWITLFVESYAEIKISYHKHYDLQLAFGNNFTWEINNDNNGKNILLSVCIEGDNLLRRYEMAIEAKEKALISVTLFHDNSALYYGVSKKDSKGECSVFEKLLVSSNTLLPTKIFEGKISPKEGDKVDLFHLLSLDDKSKNLKVYFELKKLNSDFERDKIQIVE